MVVGTLCRRKIATASPKETLRAAASRMEEDDVALWSWWSPTPIEPSVY